MNKIKIGIICPSEIAFRRFMPALIKSSFFEYIGVAYPNLSDWNTASAANIEVEKNKALNFKKKYGGQIFEGYQRLLERTDIDAVYLPLPPALHYEWAKMALMNNKHVFVEKPSTTNSIQTNELVEIANKFNLALHENYMFQYHKQISVIKGLINTGIIGNLRLIRTSFGFPKRSELDFRYNRELGGGALLDCGGYPIKLLDILFDHDMKINSSNLFYNENNVDIYGSIQVKSKNISGQISFGMDNSYRCDLDIWGSVGSITTNRIFTAPDGLKTEILVTSNEGVKSIEVDPDDTFEKSIDTFYECIINKEKRLKEFAEIKRQIDYIDIVKGERQNEENND